MIDTMIKVMNAQTTDEEQAEIKLQLIKHTISTPEGWESLATIIQDSEDSNVAKENCIKMFNEIADRTSVRELKKNFVDQLLKQLEDSLLKLKK